MSPRPAKPFTGVAPLNRLSVRPSVRWSCVPIGPIERTTDRLTSCRVSRVVYFSTDAGDKRAHSPRRVGLLLENSGDWIDEWTDRRKDGRMDGIVITDSADRLRCCVSCGNKNKSAECIDVAPELSRRSPPSQHSCRRTLDRQ